MPDAGGFSLVYLVYNTIGNLLEQSEQVACFVNAAEHLRPGGTFVIELYIPQLRRMPPGESSYACEISSRHLNFAWPAELDLMAQLAGLRLRERWGDWARTEFTAESAQHISVWEKPAW